MREFHIIKRLPPYVFNTINQIKYQKRKQGEDIIDLGMGNPDQATPAPIVEKLCEAVKDGRNHRYSMSRGIPKLRLAITDWYKRRFNVELDPETEAVATIGSKEGLSHLLMAMLAPGDVVLVPNPTYPIHLYGVIIAGGHLCSVPLQQDDDFFESLTRAYQEIWPRATMLMISFPHNPTTAVTDLEFMEKVVQFALEHNIIVVHDFAYAELCFDGYKPPSIMQVKDAKKCCLEVYSLSKSYNMPGWRVGFCVGSPELVNALTRLKSYLDYGIFQPIQIASIIALNQCDSYVQVIKDLYQDRRDTVISGLNRLGWEVPSPKGTMFVWARIPEQYRHLGSMGFSQLLLEEAKVAVSPGIGFGDMGDQYIRIALCENEHRIRQAIRGLRKIF